VLNNTKKSKASELKEKEGEANPKNHHFQPLAHQKPKALRN
jgi:hypothetical protein